MDKPSLKSERYWLKRYDVEAHPNSGRGKWLKGDGSDDIFVWDVKETNKSFHFNQEVWNKICSDAYKTDPYKNPALLIILGGRTRLALIEAEILKDLKKQIQDLKDEIDNLRADQGTERPE